MTKKPFKRGPFRDWLDCLAAVVCKTRDNFTCQWRFSDDCQGTLMPGDRNIQACHTKSKGSCVMDLRWELLNLDTACGQCHAHMHANPDSFGVWCKEDRPHIYEFLNEPRAVRPWKEADYLAVERTLLGKALDLDVDYMSFPQQYRVRFKARMSDLIHSP